MPLPRMGGLFSSRFSDCVSIGAIASFTHTTKPRQMTSQGNFQELTDEQLEHITGGGPAAVASWIALNAFTLAIPAMVDLANGSPYAKEALESKY